MHLVIHCTVREEIDQKLDHLPNSLTHLTISGYFNQPLTSLPPFLTNLTLSNEFDRPLPPLPPSITHLTFGHAFNQPIHTLPSSLTHLIFGDSFNNAISTFTSHIVFLEFGKNYAVTDNLFKAQLPPSLRTLHIPPYPYISRISSKLPPSITTFVCDTRDNISKMETYLQRQYPLPLPHPNLTMLTSMHINTDSSDVNLSLHEKFENLEFVCQLHPRTCFSLIAVRINFKARTFCAHLIPEVS